MHTRAALLLALSFVGAAPALISGQRASPAALAVTTESGSGLEQRGREQLLRIVREHPVERWLFTARVHIRSRVIPHSHPVLTLNTQYLDDDDRQLATFLHEQLHWFLESRTDDREAAIRELRRIFPTVPVRGSEGAQSEYSTYLHLLVCTLELDAVSELVGEARARELLGSTGHYRWIYRQVLDDTRRLRSVLERHRLIPPPSDRRSPDPGEVAPKGP